MSKDTSVKLHNSLPGTPNFFRQLAPRPAIQAGKTGWLFQLWAPEADQVSVAGDFNRWDRSLYQSHLSLALFCALTFLLSWPSIASENTFYAVLLQGRKRPCQFGSSH